MDTCINISLELSSLSVRKKNVSYLYCIPVWPSLQLPEIIFTVIGNYRSAEIIAIEGAKDEFLEGKEFSNTLVWVESGRKILYTF